MDSWDDDELPTEEELAGAFYAGWAARDQLDTPVSDKDTYNAFQKWLERARRTHLT